MRRGFLTKNRPKPQKVLRADDPQQCPEKKQQQKTAASRQYQAQSTAALRQELRRQRGGHGTDGGPQNRREFHPNAGDQNQPAETEQEIHQMGDGKAEEIAAQSQPGQQIPQKRHIQEGGQKIGVVYGSPETTTGGNALKFYATIRMDIRRTGGIKQGDEILGNETRVKVVKNKVAPPFKQAEFEIIYGQGISREGEIIDIGTDMDIFNKSGAWYSYQGNKIGQGKAAAREWLKSHPEEMKMIEEQIKAAIKGKDHEEDAAEEVVTKETEETYEDAQ